MESPSSTLQDRPAKRFKPNSFNVDSFIANFHRNPSKSIQIIPKMSRADSKKFIKLNGLRHLTKSLQDNKNEKEIISLLHYKKIPFDVEIYQSSGLGEEVFRISTNEKHPLHKRASNLVKRWRKKAKNKRSRSRSPEEKIKQKEIKKEESTPAIPKRNILTKFTNRPQKVNYNPDHPVSWFRKLTAPTSHKICWTLPPLFSTTYKPPQSTLCAEEEKRCQIKVTDKPSDTPDEKYKQMYIFPSPLEIDCRDDILPSIELFGSEVEAKTQEEVPSRNVHQTKKRKSEDQRNFNKFKKEDNGRQYRRKDVKRRRFREPQNYQHSRFNSKHHFQQQLVVA